MGLRWGSVSDDAIGVVDDFNEGSERQNTSAFIIRRSRPRNVGEKEKRKEEEEGKTYLQCPCGYHCRPTCQY